MSPQDVHAVLAYASSVDPRIRRNDPDERALQARAWHAQLALVDAADARAAVDRHYAAAGVQAILPGDIRAAARAARAAAPHDRTVAEALAAADAAHYRDRPALPGDTAGPRNAAEAREYLAAALGRAAAARRMPSENPTGYIPRVDRGRGPSGREIPPAPPGITICRSCAGDIPAPPGWDPTDPASPALYCGRCAPDRVST